MTFAEAENKLRSLAGKHNCSLSYEKHYYERSPVRTSIWAYIEPVGFGEGSTFEEALLRVKEKLEKREQPFKKDKPRISDGLPEPQRQMHLQELIIKREVTHGKGN